MAIILVHNLEHFIFPVHPTEQPAWLAVLNDGVFNVIFSLFAGKAYAIFRSFVPGLHSISNVIIRQRKEKDFGYRFLWRLVLLLGFATLNAAFSRPERTVVICRSGLVYFWSANGVTKAS